MKNKSILNAYHFVFSLLFVMLSIGCIAEGSKGLEPAYSDDLQSVSQEAYPISSSFREEVENDIKEYQEALAQEDLTAEERARVESLLTEAQIIATKVSAPTASPKELEEEKVRQETRVASEEVVPTEVPELGIFDSGIYFEVHVPRTVEIRNIWQGYVNGELTRIYAGRAIADTRISTSIEKDDSNYGALHVMVFKKDGSVEVSSHQTADEIGALRISDAKDEYLILDSETSERVDEPTTVYFSLESHQIATSLDKLDRAPTPIQESEETPAYP